MASPELEAILSEIDKALGAKLYYLAIAVTLSLPDICSCLECDPDRPIWSTSKKYIAWCEKNLAGWFANLDGADLYRLRGGVLHQGHFDHPDSKFDRVIFLSPDAPVKMHDIVVTVLPEVAFSGVDAADLRLSGQLLHLDTFEFCRVITNGVRSWADANAADPFVQRNLPNLVRYRPNGLPPFSVGVPTVA